ncbi:hypothetical protein L1987_08819 [Smallanthus sonchifolius]|uniref:Uncharacterized protein n=1 Tax=Smallanthus sonchifolius TaxID=185202 RepID=A0ACB9JM79_9ASTR|nr:hypothetical protein L1987_08819 [Smallanthus sonchifolius]
MVFGCSPSENAARFIEPQVQYPIGDERVDEPDGGDTDKNTHITGSEQTESEDDDYNDPDLEKLTRKYNKETATVSIPSKRLKNESMKKDEGSSYRVFFSQEKDIPSTTVNSTIDMLKAIFSEATTISTPPHSILTSLPQLTPETEWKQLADDEKLKFLLDLDEYALIEDWISDEEEIEVEMEEAEQIHYETVEGVEISSKFIENDEAEVVNEITRDDWEKRRGYGGKQYHRHHLSHFLKPDMFQKENQPGDMLLGYSMGS